MRWMSIYEIIKIFKMCILSKRYHAWLRAMEEEKRRDREREAARQRLIAQQDKDINLD